MQRTFPIHLLPPVLVFFSALLILPLALQEARTQMLSVAPKPVGNAHPEPTSLPILKLLLTPDKLR